mgnify:CR=1 FL=1
MAYVAMGAPPIVDGVTAEVKSHAKTTLSDAIQLNDCSERKRILAAENQTLNNDTTTAITKPGNLLGERYRRTPGVYVQ